MKRKFEKTLIALITLLAIITFIIIPGHLLTIPSNRFIPEATPPYKEISITNKYGNDIKGWFAEGSDSSKVILLLHPLRLNRKYMKSRADFLLKNGYSVCLIDLQAHGQTKGKKVTFGYKESDDVIATVNYLKSVMKFKKVGIVGVSLGGAAAILSKEKIKVDALILESVYSEIKKAIDNRVKMRLGPIHNIVTQLLLKQIKPILKIDPELLNPIKSIDNNPAPKFIISGTEDKRTTKEETILVYEKITSKKELWLIDKAKHEDLYKFTPQEYEKRVLKFLSENMKQSSDQDSVNNDQSE